MSFRRFLALSILASTCVLPLSLAQTSPSQNAKRAAEPSSPAGQTNRDETQSNALKDFEARAKQTSNHFSQIDRGIFLQNSSEPGSVCGAIISYNFSRGDNPRLESVTTCTPAGKVTNRYADGKSKKPAGPQLIQTGYK